MIIYLSFYLFFFLFRHSDKRVVYYRCQNVNVLSMQHWSTKQPIKVGNLGPFCMSTKMKSLNLTRLLTSLSARG